MRIAYFDCLSGISGNMVLGAMLACGLDRQYLLDELDKLHLHGWEFHTSTVSKLGIEAIYVEVVLQSHHHHEQHGDDSSTGETPVLPSHQHEHNVNDSSTGGTPVLRHGDDVSTGEMPVQRHAHHEHHAQDSSTGETPVLPSYQHEHNVNDSSTGGTPVLRHEHRGLREIVNLIHESELSEKVKTLAVTIFTRLGEAEAQVHGTTPDEVHFHEVGAIDALIDIVGTAIGVTALGIERVVASPLPLGQGWVTCAHGVFPVPAPATALLVQNVPIATTDIVAELVTPTGAAIITTLAEHFGPLPSMTVRKVGYGAGSHDLPRPNVLRLFLGETLEETTPTDVLALETNVDDLSAEVLGYVMERLFTAGALDVYYTAIQMKKNRPGVLLSVLCTAATVETCTDIIFRETTTLGIRRIPVQRIVLPRTIQTVTTRYGAIRVKISEWNGMIRQTPEYDDCRSCAQAHGVPLQTVYDEVRRRSEELEVRS